MPSPNFEIGVQVCLNCENFIQPESGARSFMRPRQLGVVAFSDAPGTFSVLWENGANASFGGGSYDTSALYQIRSGDEPRLVGRHAVVMTGDVEGAKETRLSGIIVNTFGLWKLPSQVEPYHVVLLSTPDQGDFWVTADQITVLP